MPSLDAVPDDIVLEIAAHVAEPDYPVTGSAALAPLSLVCRALHRPVRMAMLATVVVTQRTHVGGLVRLLHAQPELASHVQRVNVIRDDGRWDDTDAALSAEVWALGRLAVNIRSLVVITDKETGSLILRAVGDHAHGLEELDYYDSTNDTPSGEAAIVVIKQQARSLRRISYWSSVNCGAPIAPLSMPQLTDLTFRRRHGEDTLTWLLGEVPRLDCLAIGGEAVRSVPDALAARLRKLDIAVSVETSGFRMAWLARFQQLASLSINAYGEWLGDEELLAMPPTVEHLKLIAYEANDMHAARLERVLADASWLPALKSVAVCALRKRDASMPFGELRAVAARRGVEIEIIYLR